MENAKGFPTDKENYRSATEVKSEAQKKFEVVGAEHMMKGETTRPGLSSLPFDWIDLAGTSGVATAAH